MGYKIVLFICVHIIVNFTSAEYQSYKGYKLYKIVPKDENEVRILKEIEKTNEHVFWTQSLRVMSDVQIMVAPEKQEKFEKFITSVGVIAKTVMEDVQVYIDAQLRRQMTRQASEYDWTYYQNLEEIYEWLNETVQAHSNVATLVNMGTTIGGRDMLGIKIDYKQQESPIIGLLDGGLHAREWITPATMTWVIKEFLTSDDPDIRFMAENIVWHIFPVTNPDGYVYTFTDNRMWRKNRQPANNVSCTQFGISDDASNGVDLNRNFGFLWMTVGASSNPCSEIYAGPVANSEMETRNIINYVTKLQTEGDLVFFADFHSYTNLILVPYSHVQQSEVLSVPNYGDLFEIAVRGSDKMQQRHNNSYRVGTSADILYEVSGSSFDWVKGVAEVPIVFLFELRDSGEYGFLLPPEQIIPNSEEVMDGLIEMDKVARRLGYYSYGNILRATFSLILVSVAIFFTL